MSQQAVVQLSQLSGVPVPEAAKAIPRYWYVVKAARLGGRRRMELHGPLGTFESRRKGGLAAIAGFRANPELARKRGFAMRKPITKPVPSELLAEFIGIMLGDGGMRNSWQITISFNGREDQLYAAWICKLVKRLFSVKPTYVIREEISAADLLVSSTELVDFLAQLGVPRGHKLRHGLTIPEWIMEEPRFRLACVRGLMDTDGSIYVHHYRVNGVAYQYAKLCFASGSPVLLNDVYRILKEAGYSPRRGKNSRCVYLERSSDVDRYFSEIDTHNPRYRRRYESAVVYRGRSNVSGEVAEWSKAAVC